MADGKYLRQYESRLLLKNSVEVLVRPVVATDAPRLVDMFNKMTPHSRYLRLMTNNQELPECLLHQFTHLDYHASFAIACLVVNNDQTEIIAVASYTHDPDEHIADRLRWPVPCPLEEVYSVVGARHDKNGRKYI